MPIDLDKPENTLANVQAYVEDFIGTCKEKVDIPTLIDSAIKRIHRRWHPRWTKTYVDTVAPSSDGIITLPSDFEKLSRLTNQSDAPDTFYEPGVDYDLQGYNTSITDPRRRVKWIEVPETDLSIRIWYFRKQKRATDPDDLVDMNDGALDLILYACEVVLALKSTNLDAYDRWNVLYETELQRWIDDDTENDASNSSIPKQADGSVVTFDTGELI